MCLWVQAAEAADLLDDHGEDEPVGGGGPGGVRGAARPRLGRRHQRHLPGGRHARRAREQVPTTSPAFASLAIFYLRLLTIINQSLRD
jgi:hypothetical protein